VTGRGFTPRRPTAAAAALALGTLCGLFLACGGAPEREGRRPNLLVVLVDALRADGLGAYGASPSHTPVLDRLAERGLLFRRAFSNAPKTVPSVASLFTSTPPWVHRIEAGPDQPPEEGLSYLDDRLVLAPEVLQANGYHTAMVTTHGWITPEVHYDQGVDEYLLTEREDSAVVAAAEGFIERHAGAPFFAYVHLLDLHDYYHSDRLFGGAGAGEDASISPGLRSLQGASPSEIYRELRTHPERFTPADAAFLRRAYDRELGPTDASIGRLLAALERAGVLNDTVVVVTADHGEQFLEHGLLVHGGNGLYQEVLHVPLLIAGPGVEAGVVDGLTAGIDLFPTLFSLVGVEAPEEFLGVPRAGAVAGPEGDSHVVVATSGSAWKLITDEWSYILSEKYHREELYDLAADPGEHADLAPERPEVAREMRRILAREIRRGLRHPYLREIGDVERVAPSDDVEKTLRSLGYVGDPSP